MTQQPPTETGKPDAAIGGEAAAAGEPAPRVWLGIGSNLGDRHAHLQTALDSLIAHPRFHDIRVSDVWESDPVGGPAQPDYLNVVIETRCSLPLADVLQVAQNIELAGGRVRDERWGPRTIDVDVIAAEGHRCNTADLQVPHPRAHERAFVVVPLSQLTDAAEILGQAVTLDWSTVRQYPVPLRMAGTATSSPADAQHTAGDGVSA